MQTIDITYVVAIQQYTWNDNGFWGSHMYHQNASYAVYTWMDPDIDGRQALPKHFVLILLDAIKLEQYRASDTEGLPRCVVAPVSLDISP